MTKKKSNEECALDLQAIIEEEFQKHDGVREYPMSDIQHFVNNWNENRDTNEYPQAADAFFVKTAILVGLKEYSIEYNIQRIREGIFAEVQEAVPS